MKFVIITLIIIKVTMEWNLTRTEKIWNTIVQNLELYKEENKTYPNTLNDLIPKYFDKIPHSQSGNRTFFYYYDEKNKPIGCLPHFYSPEAILIIVIRKNGLSFN